MSNVKIKINDRELEVPSTSTVLEAALANGIDIPYMCYHPGMKVVAVCRVCQVEVKGVPKLQTACSTPVRDGMEVSTESPAARKARQGTVEFWLLNHPLDCPICDKGGECPLQDVTYNLRGGGSRLRDPKVHRPKRKVLGEHIIFDAERCILCWRCTRFTQDISGSDGLMLVNRGVKTEIDIPNGRPLDDPFSGNLADVCPVGSLTTREFRFKSRPWEMTAVESTCTACSLGCSNTLWSKRGVMQRMTARPNLEVNDYWLCDRGRFELGFVNDAARLTMPVSAAAETSDRTVSWEEAAHAFRDMVRGADGGWAVVASPHATNEEYFALQRFARGVLETNDLVLDTGDGGPELSGARIALAQSGRMLSGVAALDRSDLIVQVGGNLEATHPVLSLRVRKAVRTLGSRLLLASTADGGLDGEAFRRVSVKGGGEAEALRALAGDEALAKAERPVLLLNAGVRNEACLEEVQKLLSALPKLSVLVLDDAANLVGAWDAGFAPGHGPGRVPAGSPGKPRAAVLEAIAAGKIRNVLVLNSGRPWTFSADVASALDKAQAIVAFDILPAAHHERARLVFPAPSMAELDGTVTAPDHRVLLLRRAVPGPEGVWHPAQVLARVERLMGGEARSGSPVDVFRDLTRAARAYEGLNYGLLRPTGRSAHPAVPAAAGKGEGS